MEIIIQTLVYSCRLDLLVIVSILGPVYQKSLSAAVRDSFYVAITLFLF